MPHAIPQSTSVHLDRLKKSRDASDNIDNHAKMSVPRARLLDLMKVRRKRIQYTDIKLIIAQAQCQVFATTFNPEGVRMGNKILRQRLKGPAVAAYYPRKMATIKDVKREFGPVLATWDEGEEDRFEYIEEYVDI